MVFVTNHKSQVIFSLLLVLSIILLGMRIVSVNQRGVGKAFGWSARLAVDHVVTNIDPASPAALAGVKIGDKIIGFNDKSGFESDLQKDKLIKAFRLVAVNGKYTLKVRRGDDILKFDISSDYRGSYHLRYNIIQYHIIGVVFLGLGVGILLLKPYDRLSMIFSAFLMGLSACYIPVLSSRLPIVVGLLTDLIQYGFIFVTPYLLMNFFLLFPEPIKQNRLKISIVLLYPLYIIQTIVYLIPKYIDLYSPILYSRSQFLISMATIGFNSFYLLFLAAILIGLALLFFRFNKTNSKINKLKLSWVLLGIVIGLPPLILLNGLGQIIGIEFSHKSAMAAGLVSLVFPLTFGYAIVKHRVLDIRWVLRRSVKYILMSRIVHAIEGVVIVLLLYYFLPPFMIRMGREDSLNTVVVISILIYTAVLWILGVVNDRITRILDRIYFREDHYAEALLIKLSRSMADIRDQQSLYELIAEEITNAIHIDKVAFFLPEKEQSAVGAEFGLETETSTLSPVSQLIYLVSENRPDCRAGVLKQSGKVVYGSWATQINCGRETPIEICYEDQSSWVHQMPKDVYHALREVNSNLLVPLTHNGAITGLISLGEKLSELPYTSNDINLILSLVAQINIVIDRIMLLKQVSHQERLKKEIEIAQSVQARLFPQGSIRDERLEVAGSCIPARIVGGDYYDYIESSDGKLGIAIGDAAGKGISGALIMSSLRSSLRSMVLTEKSQLGTILYNLNNILCHSISPDKFVTFFYCVYDKTENTITYINAGHEPPIILRSPHQNYYDYGTARDNNNRALNITYADKNGLVLGVSENYNYEQHTIHLSEGDILVAYTDGITEARNILDEEYGIDRLKAVVCQHSLLPVGMLKSLILEEVRKFIGDREQQDDITLIIAKV